ncbi:MAG: 4Fe-4S dicluster domain-containing protein [Deltaproteobacteria bacterium]|nr:4Fe-4S dicluster domain-containing protein [Deltaproteobacteria bacterium]
MNRANEPKTESPVWRSLDERRQSEPRDMRTQHEKHPGALLETRALLDRRGFMQYTGLTAAALGLSGCIRRPVEEILPYTRAPEYQVPGVPLHFATAVSHRGDALGLLATQHDGRPTKLEGNPDHTGSRGATGLIQQQAIWDLYDPDRARIPAQRQGDALRDSSFAAFDQAFDALLETHVANGGRGLRVLARATNSPSFIRLRDAASARLPQLRFHTWDSVNEANILAGARLAFGQPLGTVVDYGAARVVLSIDSDFLGTEPSAVRSARAFGPTRAIERPEQEMSRLYVVESTFSVTGGSADHRLRLAPSQVDAYVRALARTLQTKGDFDLGAIAPAVAVTPLEGFGGHTAWLDAVADDLIAHRGMAPVVLGSGHSPALHGLVHAINLALGNVGRCIKYFAPVDAGATDPVEDLKTLVADIGSGSVETVIILGANPVYDAPGDVDVRAALGRDGLTVIQLSSHRDETSELATWHVPEAHFLEAWGDHRAIDGTVSPQQPLIAPLWGGRAPIELLARVAGEANWRSHYVVRQTFRTRFPGAPNFGREWRRTLHRGVVAGTGGVPLRPPRLQADAIASALARPRESMVDGLELVFLPDSRLFDGRYANNIWALELPEPMTKVVWDNAAIMSPATARQLDVRNNDVLRVSLGEASIEIPAFVLPGHADNTFTLHLGWGRPSAGRYGSGKGFDVRALRSSEHMHHVSGATAIKLPRTYAVVHTQEHGSMEGRPIALDATLEAWREDPRFAQFRSVDPSEGPLWERQDYGEGHQWGMTIDLGSCTGCNACVIACQAENNIPVVGKDEVARGREMSWMRIDRYFVGDEDDPRVALSPVTCQQCEEAPCENVCPVTATSHTPEGLNDMTYNRCVGTRYCANNCPYKVRRFNYLSWHEYLDGDPELIGGVATMTPTYGNMPETRKMQYNPNVTVRMRGVMEKCSYCVQRIEAVKIAGRREHRELRDGDIRTACQQTCATGAITFGDLNDPRSHVARKVRLDRGYHLLAELGVHPRTTFLARIRNTNPAMGTPAAAASEEAEG